MKKKKVFGTSIVLLMIMALIVVASEIASMSASTVAKSVEIKDSGIVDNNIEGGKNFRESYLIIDNESIYALM